MQLESVEIRGFRAIQKARIYARALTTIIGPNNTGKSSILRAIWLLRNPRQMVDEDFHSDGGTCYIEADFHQLEPYEQGQLCDVNALWNGKLRIRLHAEHERTIRGTQVHVVYEVWTDLDRNGAQMSRADWHELDVDQTQEILDLLPRFLFIPAVQDAAKETRPNDDTLFGKLISSLILSEIRKEPEYAKLKELADFLAARLTDPLEEAIQGVEQVAELVTERVNSLLDSKVHLGMSQIDIESAVRRSLEIYVNQPSAGDIGLQGLGAQRSILFALTEAIEAPRKLSDEAAFPGSTPSPVLFFEEPELYLHPQLITRMRLALKTLVDIRHWQVMITTHSPFLIDVADDPRSLVLMRWTGRPEPVQLTKDPFADEDGVQEREMFQASIMFNPTVCSAFFAKRAVLVEGPSEVALLGNKALCARCGISPEQSANCSVVPCGGKWPIIPLARLLKQFGVAVRVVHDRDRKGRLAEELERCQPIDPYRANIRVEELLDQADVFVVDDTLEDILWDGKRPASSADKPYRVWKRAQQLGEKPDLLEPLSRLRELFAFTFKW